MAKQGIVILAGGRTYFLNAYLNCMLLQEMGCKLPVEWFYLGKEMKPKWIKKINDSLPLVRLIDLGGEKLNNAKDGGGWQKKVDAVIESSFEDIIFLDADCFPLKDPAYIFDHSEYQTADCFLYPDITRWSLDKQKFLSGRFGIVLGERQIESGQMLFKKSKCIDGLLKVRELNRNSDETYKVVYGDKDTFWIGMKQANQNVKIVKHECNCIWPIGLLHKDFDGTPLFFHFVGGKWQPHGRPFVKLQDFPKQLRCVEICKELKKEGLL